MSKEFLDSLLSLFYYFFYFLVFFLLIFLVQSIFFFIFVFFLLFFFTSSSFLFYRSSIKKSCVKCNIYFLSEFLLVLSVFFVVRFLILIVIFYFSHSWFASFSLICIFLLIFCLYLFLLHITVSWLLFLKEVVKVSWIFVQGWSFSFGFENHFGALRIILEYLWMVFLSQNWLTKMTSD